jgi:hypothetical protein
MQKICQPEFPGILPKQRINEQKKVFFYGTLNVRYRAIFQTE